LPAANHDFALRNQPLGKALCGKKGYENPPASAFFLSLLVKYRKIYLICL